MRRDNREVENTLLSKFAFTRADKAVDHRWLQLVLPGLPAILTKFSHTREDIGNTLWKKIADQLRVQSSYLSGMIDCRNSRQDYYAKVSSDPQPPWNHLIRGAASRLETSQPSAKRRRPRKK